ncbi:transcriptional regulator CysB [Mergibacter septicus]|uniref:HTH-type transcriptional regulator CysB n=1 Tax=Mergibacter septicus TaxID=221402 RepID=UPI001C77CA19|nr:HTH-type transcriptional regulator CysB [Mergibacter septicus]QDJ12702.1 transcriptional regulator CysB [Mergibacter septicus]
MKLQQLRYLVEIVNQDLNVTEAANKLYTSQPGISKQVRLLEDELGVEIFERSGRHLRSVTPTGEKIIALARELLVKAQGIKLIAEEHNDPEKGGLRIATTHTQTRYVLPEVVKRFRQRYPYVSLHIHQGSPQQIYQALIAGEVDLAISTEAQYLFEEAILLPCYFWNRSVVVPLDHPLAQKQNITLQDLGQYPLITYTFGFYERSELDFAFNQKGIIPNIVFTATDTDVIKTYIRMGLGIGIIASMAYTESDQDLIAINASHLFNPSMTQIAFKKGSFLRNYMYDFIEFFSPHLTRQRVEQAERGRNNLEVQQLFADIELIYK